MCRLTKVLAGAAREENRSKGAGGCERLLDDTGRLSGLKYKLICCFKLVGNMIGVGIREFVNNTDGPAFLERKLIGLGCGWVRVHNHASGPTDVSQIGVPFFPSFYHILSTSSV